MSKRGMKMPTDWGFGPRIDGTLKGPGFWPGYDRDGNVVTEYAAGDPSFLYPLVYEGITPAHRQAVLDHSGGAPVDPWVWRDVQATALYTALRRAVQGVSPFHDPAWDGAPMVPVMGNFGVE